MTSTIEDVAARLRSRFQNEENADLNWEEEARHLIQIYNGQGMYINADPNDEKHYFKLFFKKGADVWLNGKKVTAGVHSALSGRSGWVIIERTDAATGLPIIDKTTQEISHDHVTGHVEFRGARK